VNLSPQQLISSALLDELELALTTHGVDPACLIIEITEGAMMRDTDVAIANLSRLRDLGARVAIDDFGTGYSSLAYLQRFPIDILKIDKSFVDGIDTSNESGALARAIVNVGRSLHLTTVAEGIESPGQLAHLLALDCEMGQGYHFARPLSPVDIESLLLTSGSPILGSAAVSGTRR
jgi:EAL domain-containing protein (putative c-di-GMP-specific phosphodiesterase class I)